MSDMVLDIQTLPEMIFSRISTEKVRIHEENGTIVLSPVKNKPKPNINELFGMFSDGKLSSFDFIKQNTFGRFNSSCGMYYNEGNPGNIRSFRSGKNGKR